MKSYPSACCLYHSLLHFHIFCYHQKGSNLNLEKKILHAHPRVTGDLAERGQHTEGTHEAISLVQPRLSFSVLIISLCNYC